MMLFSKKYQITVTDPCNENWEGMTPIDKGRFCASCSKSVVDYSVMSDKQINEMIRNASGNMCGRFRKEQLKKTYTLRPQVQLSAQRRFFQYILTFLFVSKAFVNKVIGQTDSLKTEQTDSLKLVVKSDSCITDTVALAQADTEKISLDGCFVLDPHFYPIPDLVFPESLISITMVSGGTRRLSNILKDFEANKAFFMKIRLNNL